MNHKEAISYPCGHVTGLNRFQFFLHIKGILIHLSILSSLPSMLSDYHFDFHNVSNMSIFRFLRGQEKEMIIELNKRHIEIQ